MTKRTLQLLFALLVAVLATGCAHPINMNPDLASVRTEGIPKIDKKVAYHISDASRALEITTPGGGGDKVRYFPYRDLEPGLYAALSEVFSSVSRVADLKETAAIKKDGVTLVFTPEIQTVSSSPSLLTWPPTMFQISLTCRVTDPDGKPLGEIKVTGVGRAEFEEFKSNFSLAAVRASNETLKLLVKALSESDLLRK